MTRRLAIFVDMNVGLHKILMQHMADVIAMEISYSAWQGSTVGIAVLKGDCFPSLFDRRYASRLDRMIRVFF